MDNVEILSVYVPPHAAPVIARWINYFQCEFKISRNRDSKYGDYRPPFRGKGHRISVNYNLNPYAFLVTTVHEFAHLLTWNEHKQKALPHGAEWKANFKRMMNPFFEKQVFPPDVESVIKRYLANPAASSCSDLTLFRVLRKYDIKRETDLVTVEKLPPHSCFNYKGRSFRKEELIRKRYRCVELKTGRIYLFSPLAEISIIED